MKIFSAIMVLILLVLGCDSQQVGQEESDKIYVVTTTGMVADAAKNVGKDWIRLDSLMGPGVDPHIYKATANDTRKLAEADVIFYNGLHLEGKIGDILEQLGREKPVHAVTKDIPRELLLQPEEYEGLYDPHVWFDVSLWQHAVKKVSEVLSKMDPKNAKHYQSNAKEYLQELQDLDKWVKEQVAKIPEEHRVLVTAHDAFEYFGNAYGIEVIGLQGISTAGGYGVKDVERIVDFLVEKKIRAVFVESSVPSKALESVVEGCQAQGHKIQIGGTLYSDAMGKKGTLEGTYIGMVKHNIKTISKALLAEE